MLIYIVAPFALLIIILLLMRGSAQKQKLEEEQKRQALFNNFGFEAKTRFKQEIQDVLELLESHHISNTINITQLYEHKNNPKWQLGFTNVNYTHEGQDELLLIVRTDRGYPESLIVSSPTMEGLVGKVMGFVLERVQAPHLKVVEISDKQLALRYKISTDDPSDLENKLPNATLQELLNYGDFTLHLQGDLMVISLFHFQNSSTMEQDITQLINIAKVIQP